MTYENSFKIKKIVYNNLVYLNMCTQIYSNKWESFWMNMII